MRPQALNQKMPKVARMKEQYGKGQPVDDVTIPVAWNLHELQRNFIDSMIDSKKNK